MSKLRPIGSTRPDALTHDDEVLRQYLDANERDDLDAMAALWKQAESDERLERLLCEIDEGLLYEDKPVEFEAERENVLSIVRQTLGTASAAEPPTLVIADVAGALAADRVQWAKLSPVDRDANAGLMAVRTPLPATLDGPAVVSLARQLAVTAGTQYWRAFQQKAIVLRMTNSGASRAAARPARSPRRPNGRADA